MRDPDQNGVELYRDRPAEQWPRTPEGQLAKFAHRLDLAGLLAEARTEPRPRDREAGTACDP
jgi:catechol 2,3-dioxygenase